MVVNLQQIAAGLSMPGEIERTDNHDEQESVTPYTNDNTSPGFIHYKVTSPSAEFPSSLAPLSVPRSAPR